MIETRRLTKQYGNFTALDGLDLKVDAGEFFGFIGPNGAGKTTTIHILATLLQPTMGSARVAGYDVELKGREIRRAIGYMPDFFGVYPSLRVWEYLEFFAAAYEVPVDKRRGVMNDVLDLTDLGDKRESLVGTLSRGMQQRLGLARVLIHDPQVLLLDEPASGLDPRARLEMREILRELQSMGKTILLSSHILTELEEVCTSIGILYEGRLLASGPVDDVLAEVGGEQIVRVRVEGPAEAAAEALGTLRDVRKTEILDGGRTAESEILVHLAATSFDGSPEVAAFLVERGFRLHHLEAQRVDLEEAYLRLTDSEKELKELDGADWNLPRA